MDRNEHILANPDKTASSDAQSSEPSKLGSRIAALFANIGLKPGETLEQPDWSEPRNPFDEAGSTE